MSNYLVKHAIDNIWCAPGQDRQSIIKPARISKRSGVTSSFKLFLREYGLPDTTSIFHLFQIGQVFPVILNIFQKTYSWVSVETCCNQNQMLVEVYTSRGIKLPNFTIYYKYLDGNNLVFAVSESSAIDMGYSKEDIYINFYSDAYFLGSASTSLPVKIFNQGGVAYRLSDISDFNDLVNTHKALVGNVLTYINGMYVDEISVATTSIGDYMEIIHDGSIYDVVDIPVSSLLEFNSTKDLLRKYLVHLPVDPTDTENVIKFMDDNSYYLYTRNQTNKASGVMYHRNSGSSVRMLTHRDYSIMVDEVVELKKGITSWTDQTQLTLRIFIRHSGYERALVYESNKIHELYKLSDDNIKAAMVGINATVPNWQANTLESAGYTEIMNSGNTNFSTSLIEKAYGYDAISKLIGDALITPVLFNSQLIVSIPVGLQEAAVVFEYDTNGLLIDYYQHTNNEIYVCKNSNCSLVEAVVGIASAGFDDSTIRILNINPNYTYKCYANKLNAGVDVGNWSDVTSDPTSYVVDTNRIIWTNSSILYKVLTRSDKNVVCYKFDCDSTHGLIKFNILQTVGGITSPMVIPPGELDIIMNGYTLIENIDYIINFPTVVVFNKKYLINPNTTAQKFVIRAKGFPKSDLTMESGEDIGFVQYGMLSKNNKFDLHEDRVLKINAGGKIYKVGNLRTFEEHSSVSIPMATNGSPYEIKDIVVPNRGIVPTNAYDLRDQTKVTNKAISDYLSKFLPEYVPTGISTITDRYFIYSPFCCKLIYDILSGSFATALPKLQVFYNDLYVAELCQPYMYLLDYDPCRKDHQLDDSFVYVHPHNLGMVLDMNIYYYNFLSRAIKLYLNDKITLSGFLSVTT